MCLQKEEECIGFATLPDQIHRKVIKKGFHFTIMVVGKFEKVNSLDILASSINLSKLLLCVCIILPSEIDVISSVECHGHTHSNEFVRE